MRRFLAPTLFMSGLVVSVLAAVASAQTTPSGTPTRIGGTVTSFAGERLTVHAASGEEVAVTLPASVTVGARANRTLADIKPGDYVGVAAQKGTDGHLHALYVNIFSEERRGAGEGHRPMAGPDQTMTNATVAEVARAPSGETLSLKYRDGEQAIEVGSDVRIVTMVPGDRALLKPGAAVLVFGTKSAEGVIIASAVIAEKDGVKPAI